MVSKGYDLLALISGALLPLAFAPFDFALLALVSMVGLFFVCRDATPLRSLWRGLLFGYGQFGVGTSWIYISLHDFGGADPLTSIALTLLFVSVLASFPAAACYLAARFSPPASSLRLLGLLPAFWIILEWPRSWLIGGFPWLYLGYSQLDQPLAGYAPVVGIFGLDWLFAISAALILQMVYLLSWKSRAVAFLMVALVWVSGALLARVAWTQPVGEPFRVTLLQGNIPQDEKWEPENQLRILKVYLEMTRRHWSADLIVWPETAVPAFYHQLEEHFFQPLDEEARQQNSDLLIGVPMMDRTTNTYYNSLIKLGGSGGVYRKRHLVPFGEYLPLQPFSGFILKLIDIPLSDFGRGEPEQPLLEAAGYPLVASICYEDVFGDESLVGIPQGAYLVNVTNDAWFADSIGPLQHFQMARMRALEVQRYMLRATNTGVTGIISPTGQVIERAAQFERVAVSGEIIPMGGATPYSYYGDWPVLAGLALFIGVVVIRRVSR